MKLILALALISSPAFSAEKLVIRKPTIRQRLERIENTLDLIYRRQLKAAEDIVRYDDCLEKCHTSHPWRKGETDQQTDDRINCLKACGRAPPGYSFEC